ncbi:hypothetical protein FN846DRAFT_411635 [Sphaerosporella brunnea]|uniref:Uncharacterized protein n=1 Tax=Sphaerosporella brunnea TaxID=1250544 RepID=A0A5J5EGF2_9PEZI|nr:hypothetical protein FN846DRAFT_411635 [Sphaerosporella brunnea]
MDPLHENEQSSHEQECEQPTHHEQEGYPTLPAEKEDHQPTSSKHEGYPKLPAEQEDHQPTSSKHEGYPKLPAEQEDHQPTSSKHEGYPKLPAEQEDDNPIRPDSEPSDPMMFHREWYWPWTDESPCPTSVINEALSHIQWVKETCLREAAVRSQFVDGDKHLKYTLTETLDGTYMELNYVKDCLELLMARFEGNRDDIETLQYELQHLRIDVMRDDCTIQRLLANIRALKWELQQWELQKTKEEGPAGSNKKLCVACKNFH